MTAMRFIPTWAAVVGFTLLISLAWPGVSRAQSPEDAPPPRPVPAEAGYPEDGPRVAPLLPGMPLEQPTPIPAPPPRGPDVGPPPETFAPSDRGFGGVGGLLTPVVGHLVPSANYRFTWFPSEPVRGQPTDLGYTQHDVSVILPLWQDATNEWSVNAHVRAEIFNTDAVLPTTLQP